MEVHLETGTPTETLVGGVQVVAHDDGDKGGIIGNPAHRRVQ